MMKLSGLAVAVAVAFVSATAAHAAPVVERSPTVAAAADTGEFEVKPRSVHVQPSASPQQRAADSALFETMAKDLPKLPYYTRSYTQRFVNQTVNAQAAPPNGAYVTLQHVVLGTDPSAGQVQGQYGVTSTIPLRLIPVVIQMPGGGKTYDPTVENLPGLSVNSIVNDQNSPVLQYQKITVGGLSYPFSTQLLDAWVYGERYASVRFLPNYHLLFTATVGTPLQLSPTAAQVTDAGGTPTGSGTQTLADVYGRYLLLDHDWLDKQLRDYISAQKITPDTIPVFVTSYNVGTVQFGVYGYHSNVGTQAYIWHSNLMKSAPPAGSPAPGTPLEHELAETIDHPFPSLNLDVSACFSSAGYESADVLELGQADFTLQNAGGTSYSFQDLAYASWNEGEYPSSAVYGRYSMQNALRYPCF